MKKQTPYKRVLLKLSGEALIGKERDGFCKEACLKIGRSIASLAAEGVQVAVVIGGGNIFRGKYAKDFGFDRTEADQIGMLATAINGIFLAQVLQTLDCPNQVMSAIAIDRFIQPFHQKLVMKALNKGEVVIFTCGTGNPYFTTDSAASLRACEIKADALLKATKVDGVFDKDPILYPDAVKFDSLSYTEALEKDLKVMDATSVALCRDNKIKIHVFNMNSENILEDVTLRQVGGTLVD